MHRRRFLSAMASAGATAFCCGRAGAAAPIPVTFINPGRYNEAFWSEVSLAAGAAARQLGIDLSVVYGERDRARTISLGTYAIAIAPPESYVLIVNEHKTGLDLVKAALRRGLKVLMVYNALTDGEAAAIGRPREKHSEFIGQLIPDNIDAGRRIAQAAAAAVRAARPGKRIALLALSGLPVTPAAAERHQGLLGWVGRQNDVELLQAVSTDWSEDDAYARAEGLLKRYPQVNAVWCANDPIAAGVVRALTEAGKAPGTDVMVAGLNWSSNAIRAVADGRMAATVGGHVLAAAFGLVMVADHARGVDFRAQATELSVPFAVIDRRAAQGWLARFGDRQPDWNKVDFASLSRARDPSIRTYDFSPDILLD